MKNFIKIYLHTIILFVIFIVLSYCSIFIFKNNYQNKIISTSKYKEFTGNKKKVVNTNSNFKIKNVSNNSIKLEFKQKYQYLLLEDRYNLINYKVLSKNKNTFVINKNSLHNKKNMYKIYACNKNCTQLNKKSLTEIEYKKNLLLIYDNGLFIATKDVNINLKKETSLLYYFINQYRHKHKLSKLILNNKLNKLSQKNTLDQINNKSFNYYYNTKYKWSNFNLYKNKIIKRTDVNSLKFNDFEIQTRGIIFAWNNFSSIINNTENNKKILKRSFKHIGLKINSQKNISILSRKKISYYVSKKSNNQKHNNMIIKKQSKQSLPIFKTKNMTEIIPISKQKKINYLRYNVMLSLFVK